MMAKTTSMVFMANDALYFISIYFVFTSYAYSFDCMNIFIYFMNFTFCDFVKII